MPPSIQRSAATRIPQQPQAQYSLDEQLEVLVVAANKLGLYDAADHLKDRIKIEKRADEIAKARYGISIRHKSCACEETCGDVPESSDSEYAICKALPQAPHKRRGTEDDVRRAGEDA
jgi:hypothetical protein